TARTVRIENLRAYAKEHALYYDEVSPATLIEVPATPVFGAKSPRPFQAMSRTVFRCLLEDVIVSSKSNLLLTGGLALLDHEPDELEKSPVLLDVDPIVFAPQDGMVTVA